MSTQFYTDQQAPHQQTPRQQGGHSSWFRICAVVIGTAIVGAVVALALVLSNSHSSQAPATTGPSASTSTPANPATPLTRPTRPPRPTLSPRSSPRPR